MATEEAIKKATTGMMSIISGIIILINGIFVLINGVSLIVALIGINPSQPSEIPNYIPSLITLLGAVGVAFGVIVLIGAILIYVPGKQVIGSTLVISFSLFSIIIGGGFLIGLILGIIGGKSARKIYKKYIVELQNLSNKFEEVALSDRITTGTKELDSLLLGGIPEGYAVALTAPPSDERDKLVKSFLEIGVKKGQTTFNVTSEATGLENLVENFQSIFFLFLYNTNLKTKLLELPNVYSLQGTNLTNLSINLTKAVQTLNQSLKGPRRACIELSDILLHHKTEATRRWLSEIISNLNSQGFIIMVVMNPLMHPAEQLQAILDLLDGEISIYQDETKIGTEKFLRIKRLRKKEYIKSSIPIKRK